MIEYLESLRRHGVWADARLLQAVKAAPNTPADVLSELAHVRGAQATWLSRVLGEESLLPVWPQLTVEELEEVGDVIDAKARDLHATLRVEDLPRAVRYRNTQGEYETPLGEILLHVAMHGQYHRGKANALLRAAGLEPAPVDFIFWSRAGRP